MDPFISLSRDRGLILSTTVKVSEDSFTNNTENNTASYNLLRAKLNDTQKDDDSEKWNRFLQSLHAKFSEYDVQIKRQRYNVANLEDWAKSGKTQGLVIESNSFGTFMKKISEYGIAELNDVKSITPTDIQLEELNNVLNLTLKYRLNVSCEGENVFVKGNYISLKEVMNYKSDRLDVDNSCGNYLTLLNSGKSKILNIFAVNSIFIDCDVSFPLNLLSPNWEVIGNRKIDLKGAPGAPHSTPSAPDGKQIGERGEHGKPGLPGKSGGTFFGIGLKFEGGANLTISVKGGAGGPGQNGGNGCIGFNGSRGEITEPVEWWVHTRGTDKWTETDCSKYPGDGNIRLLLAWRYLFWDIGRKCFKFHGHYGKKGGNGGDGGRRGKQGKPGIITLIEFRNSSQIKKYTGYGEIGKGGEGGSGGEGGRNGEDLFASVYFPYIRERDPNTHFWKPEEYLLTRFRAGLSGVKGLSNYNRAGFKEPETRFSVKNMDEIINEYKVFIRENLIKNLNKYELLQFLYQLNSNKNVTKLYRTAGLINELNGLERQFPKLHNDVDFTPLYQSLLNRITEYAEAPKDGENSREYKKVLNYLYTASLGRIYSLKEEAESTLIINISGYLDLLKKEIETLKDLQNQSNKAEIINRYKENYKSGIDKKINEARNFILKQVTPELGNVNNEIDSNIDLLIKETIKLQEKAKEEKEALIKKKKEMDNSLCLRILFGGLKFLGQALSFLGPVGTAVGSVIETTTSITDSLVLSADVQHLQFASMKVPNLISLGDEIKIVKNRNLFYLKDLINEISEEATAHPEILSDIAIHLQSIKMRLNNVNKTITANELRTIEIDLKNVLEKKESDLASETEDSIQSKTKMLVNIKKFNKIIKLGPQIFDIYKRYKGDQTTIDALNNAIIHAENKLQKLKIYEENIQNIMVPMLQNLESSLYEMADHLSTKSQVSLDVTNWKIQSTLRDMKLQISKVTDGFEVKENLARCIEKLEEVMTTLINIYDRIQNYQQQQNLANYIADISSVSATSIRIKDPQLINVTNHLEMSIRSNLVLKEYKTALDAFKQWVFPFAEYYLGKSVLPSHLHLGQNIENLVSNAAKEIENMKQKIDLYKTSVKNNDKYIQKGEFSSRWKSTEPFYVWKNEDYKEEISKLLSGQEVVFKSHIKNSAHEKDAIKFSVIELFFKSRNETLQSHLTDSLKHFDVTARHLGNSYYRYADKISLITSETQTILFSYEKNSAGEPVRRNNVFDKIKVGDLMLSPYALWEFKLRKSTSRSSFDDLQMYKHDIDLQLSGHGSYVLKDADLLGVLHETNTSYETEKTKIKRHISIFKSDRFLTNGAFPVLSSPINNFFNLLKTYFVSNVVLSVYGMFGSEETTAESIFNDVIPVSGQLHQSVVKRSKVQKTDIAIRSREKEKDSNGITAEQSVSILLNRFDPFTKKSEAEKNIAKLIADSSKISVEAKSHSKHFYPRLKEESQGLQDDRIIYVPDINCSLLLADLISRTLTGHKYKNAIQESLLSPREIIHRKLNNQYMLSECNIKRNLRLVSSEKDDENNFWISKVRKFFESVFKFFELVEVVNSDDYIEDLRTLFIETNSCCK